MTKAIKGWKVLTHDYRPPIQGDDPVWDGTLGQTTPKVAVDMSAAECGAGWNFTTRPETALRIGGLWPDGRPSRLIRVETAGHVVVRDDKCRTEQIVWGREAGPGKVHSAVTALFGPFEAEHRPRIVESTMLWREALARPRHDEAQIEAGLRAALTVRGLDWELVRYESARAAWAARAAWDAWAAWAARDAWDALTVEYAALCGWIAHDPDLLTSGIRDAYRNGLAVAVAVPAGLGWAMETGHA